MQLSIQIPLTKGIGFGYNSGCGVKSALKNKHIDWGTCKTGGENMIQEAVEAVKTAESQADEMLKQAQAKSEEILEEAKKQAAELKKDAEEAASVRAKSRMEEAKAAGEKLLEEEAEKAKREVSALKSLAAQKKGEAVDAVIAGLV